MLIVVVKKGKKEFNLSAYVNSREMTPFQEKCNALTVIPGRKYR